MSYEHNRPLEALGSSGIRDFIACRYCRRITPTQKLSVFKFEDLFHTYELRCPECNLLLGKTYEAPIPRYFVKLSLALSILPLGLYFIVPIQFFIYCTIVLWIIAWISWHYRPNFVHWNLNIKRLAPGTHTANAVLAT